MSKIIEKYTNEEYETWRESIVATINTAKMNAALKVNALLLQLYFEIGCAILEKQDSLGWGAQVITRLSSDLQKCYPTERGFSERNLREMKRFAQAYPRYPIWQVPLAELQNGDIWQVELAKLEKQQYIEIDLSKTTWYHHISLLSKVKDTEQRAFYYLKTVEYSLRGNNVPLGVASYETYKRLPAELENILPNEEQLKNLL